jgi:hypothetical protein
MCALQVCIVAPYRGVVIEGIAEEQEWILDPW